MLLNKEGVCSILEGVLPTWGLLFSIRGVGVKKV